MKLKYQLIKNTAFSILRLGVSRCISLFLTPYTLYMLGTDRFAIWSIMASLVGYLSRVDMGVGTSYEKYIAQYYPQKDYNKVNKVINSGFVYYALLGILVYLGVHVWGERLLELFHIDDALRAEVFILFKYVVLLRVFSFTFLVFRSVLLGIQRTDLVEKIRMSLFTVNVVCTITFLALGYKLEGLILASAIVTTLKALLHMIWAYKLVPQLKFNPFAFDIPTFRMMFGYGMHLQLSRLAKMGQLHLSKLFVAHFLPLSAVTVFVIGNSVAMLMRDLASTLSAPLIPASSQLHALNDRAMLQQLYRKASQYMALLIMFLAGFFLCMTPEVVAGWLGNQVDIASVSMVARILLLGYAYYLLSDIASVVVLGMGHPEFLMRASVLKLILLTAGNIFLIPLWGLAGAAVAMSLSEIIGTIYFVIPCHRELHYPYLDVVKQIYAWPVFTGALASGATFLVYQSSLAWWFVPQGRLQHVGILALTGSLFTGIYAVVLLKSAYIDQYDKDLFWRYAQKVSGGLGRLRKGLAEAPLK